ncbi:ankyrin repeat and KH domain-containing protein mask [Galendromus occidentalis]|uniref:Alpha-latrotoxin n=1 Tax=Galendromus occidentalis TaxID=34638 RepID=A0AAJ7WHJ4_9ACAR|nr:ankyrin repeat and KH domain-containing protein mask [Galendromus occidentalis]
MILSTVKHKAKLCHVLGTLLKRSADEWDLDEEDDVVNSSASRRLILRRIASPSRYRIQSPQPQPQQHHQRRHSPRPQSRDIKAQDGQESSPPRKEVVLQSSTEEDCSEFHLEPCFLGAPLALPSAHHPPSHVPLSQRVPRHIAPGHAQRILCYLDQRSPAHHQWRSCDLDCDTHDQWLNEDQLHRLKEQLHFEQLYREREVRERSVRSHHRHQRRAACTQHNQTSERERERLFGGQQVPAEQLHEGRTERHQHLHQTNPANPSQAHVHHRHRFDLSYGRETCYDPRHSQQHSSEFNTHNSRVAMRSSEFESAPIESTKPHLDSASIQTQSLQQLGPAGSRRHSRRLTRNFSIQPEVESSCVFQRHAHPPELLVLSGQGHFAHSGQGGIVVGHTTSASTTNVNSPSAAPQRRRLKTRSTSVDIYSASPRPSVAAIYAHQPSQYATPCGTCDEACLSGDEVSVMSGSASSSCWTTGVTSSCGAGGINARALQERSRQRRVSSTSATRKSISNTLNSPALSPSRTAKSSVRSRDTGYSEGTCRSSSSSSSSSDHSSTSGALASVSDDDDIVPENEHVFSEQQTNTKLSKKVGRTKSCPVATNRPQRLLAVKDQDLLPSPLPLARSRGNFVWPPTSISPLPPILPELQSGQLPHSPRISPCTERDSAISECKSPQVTDRSPVSPSLKRALSNDTRSNKSSDGCSTGGTASPSKILSNDSSIEKKSDSEEGQQQAVKGRERKASKTSNGESDREASRTEKRLSSSTPTLAVQQSLDCDFGDKLHTAKPEIDEGDYGIGPTYKKMSEAEYLSRLSIHDAARTGDLHVIKLLIRRDKKRWSETVDERGWTPLHLAAAYGHTDIVKFLCSEGAHIRALDPTGYTSMHVAAMNGNDACLQVLLKMGADVDNEASDGFTPLHLATLNNHADCVKTLLTWGANMGREDALGRTIQDMVEEYNLEEVGTLLKNIWTQFEKYRKAGKATGSRKGLRKLIQLAASNVSLSKDEIV